MTAYELTYWRYFCPVASGDLRNVGALRVSSLSAP